MGCLIGNARKACADNLKFFPTLPGSVQYWQQPEAVCAEIVKKLKPGGVCIITFSNRCFPTKAITAWQMAGSGYARVQLVKQYFQAVEGFSTPFSLTEVRACGNTYCLWRHSLWDIAVIIYQGQVNVFI